VLEVKEEKPVPELVKEDQKHVGQHQREIGLHGR
jgi:hypothetical protein